MLCPQCGASSQDAAERCAACQTPLPLPVCRTCGITVGREEAQCFRCVNLVRSQQAAPPAARWDGGGAPVPLVGRDTELATLEAALHRVIEERRAAMVTVIGDSGIGKTRLAAALHARLIEGLERCTVAQGTQRGNQGSLYGMFRSLLADRLYIRGSFGPEEVRARLLDGVRAIIGTEAAEEHAHLIGYAGGLEYPGSPHIAKLQDDPRRLTERAREALVHLFRCDARQAPLVLVLDDLHLASEESLALVDHLAASVSDAPLLLVGLAQPSLVERTPEWGRGDYPHQRIDLQPLSDAECAELLKAYLPPLEAPPVELVDLVCARALGNPLAVERASRILLAKGVIAPAGDGWQVHLQRLDPAQVPGTLSGLVQARLDGLSDTEREVLQMAAVVGSSFWFGALCALNRAHFDRWPEEHRYWRTPSREEALRQLLAEFEEKDLVRQVRESRIPGEAEYQFKHRIERDMLYQALTGRRRREYHHLVAQWLEMGLQARSESMYEAVADHFEQGGQPERSAEFHLQAGRQAAARFLNDKAIGHLRRALELLDEHGLTLRLEANADLGSVYALIGDHQEALCCFQEMLACSWRLALRRKGGVAYEKLGQVYRQLGEYDFAMQHFAQARQLFEATHDERGIAAVLDDMGRVHWMRGDLQQALELHERSLELRRTLGDPRSIALALAHVGSVRIGRGELAEAMLALRESLELRRSVGDRRGEAESLNAFGAVFYGRRYYEQAVTMWEQGVTICEETGDQEVLAYLLNNLGEALIELERPDEADERLSAALEIARETRSQRTRATVLRNQGRIRLLKGEPEQARELAEAALDISRRVGLRVVEGQALCLLAGLSAETLFDSGGDPLQRAEELLDQALDILDEVGDAGELGHCLEQLAGLLDRQGRDLEAAAARSRAATVLGPMRAQAPRTEDAASGPPAGPVDGADDEAPEPSEDGGPPEASLEG